MLPQRLTKTIMTIMTTVSSTAVTRYESHPTNVGVTSRFTPATFSPPKTTLLQTRAMTKPNAAPSEVAIVLRISALESCFCPMVDRKIARVTVSIKHFLEDRGASIRNAQTHLVGVEVFWQALTCTLTY